MERPASVWRSRCRRMTTAVLALVCEQACAVIAVGIADGPKAVNQVKQACSRIWLLEGRGISEGGRAFILQGRKAVPLQGIDGQLSEIQEVQGQCWILTQTQERSANGTTMLSSGLFLLDGTKARKIGAPGTSVGSIVEANGTTFFLDQPRYSFGKPGRVLVRSGDELRPFAPKLDGHVRAVVAAAGRTWILTAESEKYSDKACPPDRFEAEKFRPSSPYLVTAEDVMSVGHADFRAVAVAEVGDAAVLVGHDKAGAVALRRVGNAFTPIRLGKGETTWSKKAGSDLVVATTDGPAHALHLLRADGSIVHFPGVGSPVREVADLGDSRWLLWAGWTSSTQSPAPAYLLHGGELRKIELPDGNRVLRVEKAAGTTWLLSRKGAEPGPLFVLQNGLLKPFGDAGMRARDIESAAGKVWVIDQANRVHELVDGAARAVASMAFPVQHVSEAGKCAWFIPLEARDNAEANTSRPVWRKCASAEAPEEFPNAIRVYGTADVQGEAWLLTRVGQVGGIDRGPAFLVANDLEPQLALAPRTSASWLQSAISRVWPGVWIAGPVGVDAAYLSKTPSARSDASELAPRFMVALAGTQKELDERVMEGGLVRISDASYELPLGRSKVYAALQDEWGNRTPSRSYDVIAVPGSATLGMFAVSAWALLIGASLFAAPWLSYANAIVMSPVMRGVGSFGLIPIALSTVPAARRHLLRRYRQGVKDNREIAAWRERFIPPDPKFASDNVMQLLAGRSEVLMLGRSGVGKTTYFKYLTATFAASGGPSRPPTVWIPLARYFPAHKDVEEMFHFQLNGIGGINDRSISKIFLSHGGFLILIDGLNEVDAETRSSARAFIDGNGRRNQIILSSQERYKEMDGIESVDVPLLQPLDIRRLFASELGEEAATALIGPLSDSKLLIFQIPQIAWLSCQLARTTRQLPQTELELYQSLFEPVFETWAAEGSSSEQMLCRFAFEMLSEDKPSFNLAAAGELPPAVVTWLTQQGFVRRTDEVVIFRHDTIRDYLASRYLIDHWPDLSKDANPMKAWLPTIRLATLSLRSSAQRGQFFSWLLRKNPDIAQLAYRDWKQASHDPEDWEEGFMSEFGRTLLKRQAGEGSP